MDTLRLPAGAVDDAWRIPSGESGMETLLMLMRDEPLPTDVDLEKLLLDLPKLELKDPKGVFAFDDWNLALERGDLVVTEVQRIRDPVLGMHRVLKERLGEQFSYSYSLSFGNLGK